MISRAGKDVGMWRSSHNGTTTVDNILTTFIKMIMFIPFATAVPPTGDRARETHVLKGVHSSLVQIKNKQNAH